MQFKYIIAALMVMVCLLAPSMMVVKAEKSVMGCEICEWLVATAENLANKTKPQIEQELLQICSKLGPYEQICDQMVLMELPDIIDQIIAKEPPALVCAQIKMCSNSSVVVPAVPKAQDSGICNMCQLVVNQVENWVASNDTIMTLEKKLEQVCTVIPGQYSTLCTYAVDQYLPTFIHQVEKQYPALVICQDVSLCSKQEAAPVVVAPQQSAELCPICKAAVGFLKTKISTVDVATVKKQLEFACTFFQVPDCQTLVDKAAEIAQAVQTEDANTICSTIVDVCPKKVEWNPFKKFLEAKNAKYCPTCVAITQYLENAITSDVAVAELIKLADIGCAKLGPLSGLCTKFVPLAVDELKHLILEKVTPQKVCSTLKMCDSSDKMSIAAPVPEVQADSSLCVPCEYVIGVADNWLIANNTEQSIQNTLDMVCTDFVPSVYQSQCIGLVNQYTPQLIQLFEAKVFNPQTVCKAIGVCTSQKRAAINKQIKMN